MSGAWQKVCLSVALLVSLVPLCHAQTAATPEDEYKKLIRVNEDIQPLGEHPFGENISFYDGSLSFEQTDISASGNGPLLQFSRKFQVEGDLSGQDRADYAFGDWSIALPHLETLTGSGFTYTTSGWRQVAGWQVNAADPNARCSQFAQPQTIVEHVGDPALVPWDPASWWRGYHLVLPNEGSQDMLANMDSASEGAYPVVTKSHWRFSCLSTTANGQSGEGFLAQAPDGTRYWFNQLVYRYAPAITRPLYSDMAYTTRSRPGFFASLFASHPDPIGDLLALLTGSSLAHALPPASLLQRQTAWMLVTRIEDRFGNTLTFSYDPNGNLTGITASDGRALSVQYVSGTRRILSITLQANSDTPRTWNYSYDAAGTSLTAVSLPDGSQWHYDLVNFNATTTKVGLASSCTTLVAPNPTLASGTITHPSGLTGTFTVKPTRHGRSYVTRECRGMLNNHPDTSGSYAVVPNAWYGLSVTKRVLSGAAVPTSTWLYSYSPANDSWSDCGNGCPTTVHTDVVNPDGSAERTTFSNKYDYTESQLLRTDTYAGAVGASTLMRSEERHYAAPTTAPLPASAGANLQPNVNQAQTARYSPLSQRVISQDGDSYTWQAQAFNVYAQVTQTIRSNSIAGQTPIQEATTYLNDTNLWVLGLPLQVTNLATGEVESANTYDPNRDTLLTRSRFGQTLMHYTFNSAGQLASFTDGNAHTTTLDNYYRGIPRVIGYPDGSSESLAVDDFGQITSIADQAGHTTGYSYDPVGRVTRITYPSGDEAAWNPKVFTYSFVSGAERGLAGNHWKRTVATGNAVSTTYFDAMLRPVLNDSAIGGSIQTSVLTIYDWKGQNVFNAYPSDSALTFTLSPAVAGSSTTYDALGRATQVQQSSELGALASSTAYLSGARQQVTDPKGNVTTTGYQVFDLPSHDAVIQVQAPAGITQTIARDIYGNPLSITQSGLYGNESNNLAKTLTYDTYHRLCRTTEPESGSTVMAYDAANNLAWSATGLAISGNGCGQEQVATAARTVRTYDAMNRIQTILPPAGTQSTSYGYDPTGRLISALSGISIWNGSYNFRGMLTGESLQLEGQSAWGIGYAHDANGNLSLMHYPDGENVSYAPDDLGRPTQVGGYANSIGYFPNGQVRQFLYGSGAGYIATQNARQLLSNFSYGPGGTAQLSEDLAYDKNGNITTVADLAGGPRNKSFGYDAINRLTSATASGLWGTQLFTYDALNNLRSLQSGSQTSIYHYDTSNKLASISGATPVSYTYDTRGNVASKNGTNLLFDQKNQLIQIPGVSGYDYDAAGRRVRKTPAAGGAPTYYFYSQAGQLLYQFEPGNAQATSFVYLGRKLVGDNVTVALGAPAAIGFDANPNNGSYTVSWDAVPGATSYLLQESANGSAWVTVYSGSAPSAALSGRAGGDYVYQVEGCAGTTCGAFTSSATLGVTPTLATVMVPTGIVNGAYTVSWTAPATASTYAVQERVNGGAWTTIADSTAAISISRPGTTTGNYTYQVAAYNTHGTRGWAVSGAVTVNTAYGVMPAPLPSYNVPATNATGSVTLNWTAATPVTQYILQQSSNNGASWSTVYAGLGTSVALSGLADGSYTYRLQACNDTAGNSVCTAWVAAGPMVVTHPPTTAPTLSLPAVSTNGSYIVSWNGVPGPVSYTLQESVNGGSWNTVQVNANTSWSTSSRDNGSYGYRVQGCNAGGCGPWSANASTTVLWPPPAPASISIPASSNGPVAVSWASSATATSYTLQHANYGIGGWSTIYQGGATGHTQQEMVTGSWIYQVQACNASGCSAFRTSSGGVTVTIAPAGAPSLSIPATSNTGSYTVSWGAVSGATSYILQEQVNGGGWSTIQDSAVTSMAVSGKGNGSYGYRAQACNAGGCGPWSGTGSITVALSPATPGAPSVSVSGPSYRPVVRVSWVTIAGATSYQVEETHPQTGVSLAYNGSGTTFSGLIYASGEVSYRMKACSSIGCSPYGPYASVLLESSSPLMRQKAAEADAKAAGDKEALP